MLRIDKLYSMFGATVDNRKSNADELIVRAITKAVCDAATHRDLKVQPTMHF